jgi:glucose/arabinose dehydrogenase
VDQPPGATLSVPAGFQVKLFASDPAAPRLLRTAPNGDIFIADTHSGQIRVLRTVDGADAPAEDSVFAAGLKGPFGIAFYPLGADPQWVYVANLNSVVRFPVPERRPEGAGPAETVVPRLADSTGGHSTRDVAFSLDGRGCSSRSAPARTSPRDADKVAPRRSATGSRSTDAGPLGDTRPTGRTCS